MFFFWELHTGIDFGNGGTAVNTPGGYWSVLPGNDHRGYFQLFGSNMRMRIQHINSEDVSSLSVGSIIGNAFGSTKIYNYPDKSNGTVSGIHVHIDFTKLLPYDNIYSRQFVNPETFRPGTRYEYPFSYLNSSGENMPKYPQNFIRY